MNKDKIQLMSMQELLDSGRLYWIKSLPTLRTWVKRDIERRNILRTVVITGDKGGTRYFFNPKYVEEYLMAFHKQELDTGPRLEANE